VHTARVPTHENDANGVSGNRARDHLANERTYLAWLRTCLGIAAAGALLAKVSDAPTAHRAVAATLLTALAVAVLAFGTARYYAVAKDLDRGAFHTTRSPLIVTAAVIVVFVVLPFFVL